MYFIQYWNFKIHKYFILIYFKKIQKQHITNYYYLPLN